MSQAVDFLGMRNVSGIATGLAIRHALSGGTAANHRHFWDMAEKTALLCAKFARMLRGIAVDEAYTFGRFHDCGIPLLMHHDTEVFEDRSVDEPVRNFVGIVHIAEHILNRTLYDVTSAEWERFAAYVLAHFGLGDEDFLCLVDAAQETIGA